MAIPAAVGPLSKPLEALYNTLAASATFQAQVGAADATEAKAFIRFPYAPDESDDEPQPVEAATARPRAILNQPNVWEFDVPGTGGQRVTGNVFLDIELLPVGDTREEQLMHAMNVIGSIILEMAILSGQTLLDGSGTYLNIKKFRLKDVGECVRENHQNELFYGGIFEVLWM